MFGKLDHAKNLKPWLELQLTCIESSPSGKVTNWEVMLLPLIRLHDDGSSLVVIC